MRDESSFAVHDHPTHISGRGADLDAALRIPPGFTMVTLYDILRIIHLYNLPDAYVLLWDALEEWFGRRLELSSLFAALDSTALSSLCSVLLAILDRAVLLLDGEENVAAEDHVIFTPSLDESVRFNARLLLTSLKITPPRKWRLSAEGPIKRTTNRVYGARPDRAPVQLHSYYVSSVRNKDVVVSTVVDLSVGWNVSVPASTFVCTSETAPKRYFWIYDAPLQVLRDVTKPKVVFLDVDVYLGLTNPPHIERQDLIRLVAEYENSLSRILEP